MRLQRTAGRGEVDHGIHAGKKGFDLGPLGVIHTGQRPVARLEAFAPKTIRQNDLVPVEHQMQVGHLGCLNPCDARATDEVNGGNQNFVFTEQKLG